MRIDFPPVLYICALHAHSGSCPPESSRCVEAMIVFHAYSTKNARTKWVRAEPSPPEPSEALRRHRMSSNEVFGTDKCRRTIRSVRVICIANRIDLRAAKPLYSGFNRATFTFP